MTYERKGLGGDEWENTLDSQKLAKTETPAKREKVKKIMMMKI